MENDQISIPIDHLRPLNTNRATPTEGIFTNSGVNDVNSLRSRSVFYPVTVSESGYGGGGGGGGGGGCGGSGFGNHQAMVSRYPPPQLVPVGIPAGVNVQVGFNPGNRVGGNVGEGESGGGEERKVKFLCSFGGKILPRPSDGSMRYVGGQTRIISVKRDVSFHELMLKMMETYGQSVVVKYQLPEEDLDALVSISCPEDLENMMDEYGKLVEGSSNGSAKLRLFLFSAAELDQSGLMQLSDMHDGGQKYVDAVNGVVPEVVGGKLTRRGSMASAASTQNSDSIMSAGDHVDGAGIVHGGDGGGLPTPTVLSPRESQEAGSRLVYVGPNQVMYSEPPMMSHSTVLSGQSSATLPESELGRSAVAMGQEQQPLGYDLQRPSLMDFPPATSYMPAYADPRQEAYNRADYPHASSQMGYANSHAYGMQGGPFIRHVDHPQQIPDNTVGYPSHQFVPAIHMTAASSASSGNILKPSGAQQQFIHPHQVRVNPYPDESSYGARIVQVPSDQIHRAYQPQVPPPQSPSHLQGGGYEWWQVPASEPLVFSDGRATNQQHALQEKTIKLDDCFMCQKQLPHSHSDTVVQDFGDSPMGNASDLNRAFHSMLADDMMKVRPQQQRIVVSGALEQGLVDHQGAKIQPKVVRNIDQDVASHQLGAAGFTESPKLQREHENNLVQKRENSDYPRMVPPGGIVGFSGNVNSPYGAILGNTAQAYQIDALQQPTGLAQYQVKQETSFMNQLTGTDIPPAKVTPRETSELLVHEYSAQSYGNHPGLVRKEDILEIDGRMEGVHLSPPSKSDNIEQCISPSNQPRKEEILDTRPHMMRKEMLVTNAFMKPDILSDGNNSRLVEKMPTSSAEIVYLHEPHPIELSRVTEPLSSGISGAYTDLHVTNEHKAPDEIWHAQPSFIDVDSTSATDRTTPCAGEWKNDPSQFQPRIIANDAATLAYSGNSPSAVSPSSGAAGDGRDSVPSNSLFSNQDPWNLRHGTQFPPPRPNKVLMNKETFITRDDRILQQPPGNLNKDIPFEQGRGIKGPPEENIGQELQAVAEGVAASVLQSSVSSDQSGSEMGALVPEANRSEVLNDDLEVGSATEVKDAKTNVKANIGLPISDGIGRLQGRLQIIKNNDLEELRELGSGTFGTVYHGKWRGTDVAIKRINERCFVGKPSEQDQMRNDFWNEAMNLADLHHPNVVAFYGVVVDGPGGSVATVTEYMVNGSLRQAFQKNDRILDKRKRLMIAMDVAFGMEYLHGKNIVHFDLKSDNLLVNLRDPHRPICKVGDLGLSKVKCQTLISGGVRGTLPWMAPELLNGSSNLVSEKVDVFSFGIVMWELLTRDEPYADLHYGAIIGGIVSNTLRPHVPESCDPEWRSLMERCWSADPPERPSFTEIVNQLRSMAASLPQKGQGQQGGAPLK